MWKEFSSCSGRRERKKASHHPAAQGHTPPKKMFASRRLWRPQSGGAGASPPCRPMAADFFIVAGHQVLHERGQVSLNHWRYFHFKSAPVTLHPCQPLTLGGARRSAPHEFRGGASGGLLTSLAVAFITGWLTCLKHGTSAPVSASRRVLTSASRSVKTRRLVAQTPQIWARLKSPDASVGNI